MHWAPTGAREATASRCPPFEGGCAHESEDLPTARVHPACGDLGDLVGGSAEWAGTSWCRVPPSYPHASVLSRDRNATREGEFRDIEHHHPAGHHPAGHRVRLPEAGPEPGAEEGDRGLLGRSCRGRCPPCHRRRPAPRQLAPAGRGRRHRGAHRRLLALRPRTGRHGRRRRDPAAPPRRRRRRPAGRLLRHGTRHPGRRATGDDQVVRHQLPLPGTRVGAGHRLRRQLRQGGLRAA